MLAHDAPKAYINNWGTISLPEYLDNNRSGKGWDETVTAWHITTKDKLPSILKNGLSSSSCSDWMSGRSDRPAAVYMFCARSVVDGNIRHLLDNPADVVVLRVTIPAKHAHKLHIDNMYNMSINEAEMSSIQYRDAIPAKWVTVE